MPQRQIPAVLVILGLFWLASVTAGCAPGMGSTVGNTIPHWAGGEPAVVPAPPKAASSYPAVNNMPPARPTKLITVNEQSKLKSELSTLRTQVTAEGAAVQQQRGAEDAQNKALAARIDAMKTSVRKLRKESEAAKAKRKKLEAIARSRQRAIDSPTKPQASSASPLPQ